jgi:hypothetical protein
MQDHHGGVTDQRRDGVEIQGLKAAVRPRDHDDRILARVLDTDGCEPGGDVCEHSQLVDVHAALRETVADHGAERVSAGTADEVRRGAARHRRNRLVRSLAAGCDEGPMADDCFAGLRQYRRHHRHIDAGAADDENIR